MRLGLGLGVNKGRRKSGIEPTIDALLAQAASDGHTPFSGDVLEAATALVLSAKENGWWDKMDIFYVFATNGDANFALYNWKDPSSFMITNEGNTFTSLQGFTGDATNDYALNTNWDAVNDAVNYTLDSASYGVWVRASVADAGFLISGSSDRVSFRSSSSILQRINTTNNLGAVFNAARTGLFHVNRASSTEVDYIYNGTSDVRASVSTLVSTVDMSFFNQSVSTASQISAGWFGGNLSSEKTDVYNDINTYLTAIGAV